MLRHGFLRHWQIPAHSPHGVQADIFGRAIFPDGSGGGMVESPPQPTGYEPATAHGWFGTHPRVTACVSPLGTGFSVARRVALGKSEKDTQKMERNEIRCGNCGKLLGKGTALDFEIKCPRYGPTSSIHSSFPFLQRGDAQLSSPRAPLPAGKEQPNSLIERRRIYIILNFFHQCRLA